MSHELLYTSAPKGLKAGSRGFCTVVCTQGMPAPLMTALESLSAYRHVYPPGDHNASKNPIAWSHLKLNAAGRAYHVLSRIADFGLDYSQRGNKLAHHLAIEAQEQTTGGPAWLLEQSDTMQTDWNGQPRLLPAGRQLQSGSRPPGICKAWQNLMGDAGWAGCLAESFLANPERQVYIVFEPGMNLLPLMAEAIALLPLERRWDVTFSTYFTSLPPGVSCNWRCVLSGSPEAEQARKFGKALHIDLCHPVPPASGGSLVLAARTGRSAEQATRGPPIETANVEWTDDELAIGLVPVADEEPGISDAGPGVKFADYAPAAGHGAVRLSGMPPPPPPDRRRQARSRLNDTARRSKWMRWIGSSLALMTIAFGLAVWKAPAQPFEAIRKLVVEPANREKPVAEDVKAGTPGQRKKSPKTAKLADGSQSAADKSLAKSRAGSADKNPSEKLSGGKPSETEIAGIGSPAPGIQDDPAPTEKSPASGSATDAAPASPEGKAEKPLSPRSASPSAPRSAAKSAPRLGEALLPQIPTQEGVQPDQEYELFAMSLPDAIKGKRPLRLPDLDTRAIKLGLYCPSGMPDVTARPKPGDHSEMTISKKTPFGDSPRVLTINAKSGADGDCEIRFLNEEPGWEILKWCLLSVEGPGHPLRLFALQMPALEWNSPQFKDSDFPLTLDGLGDWTSAKAIRIEAVDLAVTGFAPLHFRGDDEKPGKSLLCQLSQLDAEKVLLGAMPNLKLDLSPRRTKESEGLMLTWLPHIAAMHESAKSRLKDDLLPITNWYDYPKSASIAENVAADLLSENAGKSPKSAFATVAGKIKSNSEDLQTQIDDAKKNKDEPQVAILTRKREESEANRQKLNDLKALSESYRNFKSAFKKADILFLSLHYNFELPNPNDPTAKKLRVPVTLTFKSPGQ